MGAREPAVRTRPSLLEEAGWLRFTVVRDPWRRLWSAWVSKLLLREPRFAADYGDQPWFPRLPEDPGAVVEDFRRFVQAVGAGAAQDVHWSVQHDLSSQLPLTHIGRTEQLAETLALLHRHVGTPPPAAGDRRNTGALALPPHAYDAATAAIVRRHYAADFAAFGYSETPPEAGSVAAWEERAELVLPLLAATVDEHVRTGQLHRLAQRRAERMQGAEARLEARSGRGSARRSTRTSRTRRTSTCAGAGRRAPRAPG